MPTIKVRPGRGQSLWGAVVGAAAVVMGWVVMNESHGMTGGTMPGGFSHVGGVGALLILIGLVVLAYNLYNLFSGRPLTEKEIEVSPEDEIEAPFCTGCGRPLAEREYSFCPWCGRERGITGQSGEKS